MSCVPVSIMTVMNSRCCMCCQRRNCFRPNHEVTADRTICTDQHGTRSSGRAIRFGHFAIFLQHYIAELVPGELLAVLLNGAARDERDCDFICVVVLPVLELRQELIARHTVWIRE